MNIAVVTTRNEQESIAGLVSALLIVTNGVVVVDDASRDNTGKLAFEAGAAVIDNPYRIGIGPSLVEGWKRALQFGADRIIQIDAGGSHRVSDIPALLAVDADVVIGSRFTEGAQYEGRPVRAAMSQIAALACSWKSNQWFADWTSGYRVFGARAAHVLASQTYNAKMHGWQIEVLSRALMCGLSVKEAPITYTAGRSAFNWRIGLEAFKVWRGLDASSTWINLSEFSELH